MLTKKIRKETVDRPNIKKKIIKFKKYIKRLVKLD